MASMHGQITTPGVSLDLCKPNSPRCRSSRFATVRALGLLGLSRHLTGGFASIEDRSAWPATPEAKQFMTLSSQAWGAAHRASGATQADAAAENTAGAYTAPQAP
jgi:hypothetical protein